MRILACCLKHGSSLLHYIADDTSVLAIFGEGGGCSIDILGDAVSVWLPLQGQLRVRNACHIQPVRPRELLVTEHNSRTEAVGDTTGKWLGIAASAQGWGRLLADTSASDLQLLPDHCTADVGLCRRALALARSTDEFEQESTLRAAIDAIVTGQTGLREAVTRCPGRTLTEKRRVFLRLQRVRRFVETCHDAELDNATLARMANYSPSHFLRIFNTVYLETPHAYLVTQRLHHAARLLRTGKLAVTEVALASGFENRSAFSRRFRQYFGITAQSARRACEPAIAVDG